MHYHTCVYCVCDYYASMYVCAPLKSRDLRPVEGTQFLQLYLGLATACKCWVPGFSKKGEPVLLSTVPFLQPLAYLYLKVLIFTLKNIDYNIHAYAVIFHL